MKNELKHSTDLELKTIENRIICLKKETAQNLIQLGNELNKAKEKVPHGEWGGNLYGQKTPNEMCLSYFAQSVVYACFKCRKSTLFQTVIS